MKIMVEPKLKIKDMENRWNTSGNQVIVSCKKNLDTSNEPVLRR